MTAVSKAAFSNTQKPVIGKLAAGTSEVLYYQVFVQGITGLIENMFCRVAETFLR